MSAARTEAELLVKGILNVTQQNIFYSLSVGGDVFENVEDGIVNAQRIQQVIQHGVLPPVPP